MSNPQLFTFSEVSTGLAGSPSDAMIKQSILQARAEKATHIHVSQEWFDRVKSTLKGLASPLTAVWEDQAILKTFGVSFIVDPKLTDPKAFYLSNSATSSL